MSINQAMQWLTIGAMLLAAGIWLGKLQQQVSDMQAVQQYVHGEIHVPGGSK